MIPDEAVEAAIYAYGIDEGKALEWERKMIVSILEAAAPHLLAAAWDEGGRAAIEREHTYGREEKAKFSNPYRKSTDA